MFPRPPEFQYGTIGLYSTSILMCRKFPKHGNRRVFVEKEPAESWIMAAHVRQIANIDITFESMHSIRCSISQKDLQNRMFLMLPRTTSWLQRSSWGDSHLRRTISVRFRTDRPRVLWDIERRWGGFVWLDDTAAEFLEKI